jgi:tetratricopeptide (TPR) repeat protein
MATSARLEELQRKFDENPRRYFAPLANEYRKLGDVSQAIALCRTHLPNQPGHISGHIVLAQALYEGRELGESRQIFEAALELDPENLIALRYLGDIAREQGTASAARVWYERVLEVDPRNEEIAQLLNALEGTADRAPVADDLSSRPTPAGQPAVGAFSALEVVRDLGGERAPNEPADEAVSFAAADTDPAPALEAPLVEADPSSDTRSAHESRPEALIFDSFDTAGEGDDSDRSADEPPAIGASASAADTLGEDLSETHSDFSDLAAHDGGEMDDWFAQSEVPAEDPLADSKAHGVTDANYFPILSGMTPVAPMPAYDRFDIVKSFDELQRPEDAVPPEDVSGALEGAEAEPSRIEAGAAEDATAFDPVVAESLGDIGATASHAGSEEPVEDLSEYLESEGDEIGEPEWAAYDHGADSSDPLSAAGVPADEFASYEPGDLETNVEPTEALTEEGQGDASVFDPILGRTPDLDREPSAEQQVQADAVVGWTPDLDSAVHAERAEPELADPILGRTPDLDHAAAAQGLSEPFVTETMAELYLQQGFRQEALDIYRQLLARQPNDHALIERVQSLEHGGGSFVVPESAADAVSAGASDETDVREATAPGGEAPPDLVSARDFFGRFARREARGTVVDRISAAPEFGAPPGPESGRIGGAASAAEGLTQPESEGAGSLAALFSADVVDAPDERAALDLSSAYGTTSDAMTARGDGGELSLEQLFRDVPARAPDAVTPGSAIYSGAASAADSAGEAASRGPEDIEQFTAWLEELKKK